MGSLDIMVVDEGASLNYSPQVLYSGTLNTPFILGAKVWSGPYRLVLLIRTNLALSLVFCYGPRRMEQEISKTCANLLSQIPKTSNIDNINFGT